MKNETLLINILDRSGSMQGLTTETILGFNTLIEEQKKIDTPTKVYTVLFDGGREGYYTVLHKFVDLKDVPALTEKEYNPNGYTALNDAIGITLTAVGKILADLPEYERPDKVLVTIITDGEENASREYNSQLIKEMVERQKNAYN